MPTWFWSLLDSKIELLKSNSLDLKQEKYPKEQPTFFPCLFPEFLRLQWAHLNGRKVVVVLDFFFNFYVNQVNLMLETGSDKIIY